MARYDRDYDRDYHARDRDYERAHDRPRGRYGGRRFNDRDRYRDSYRGEGHYDREGDRDYDRDRRYDPYGPRRFYGRDRYRDYDHDYDRDYNDVADYDWDDLRDPNRYRPDRPIDRGAAEIYYGDRFGQTFPYTEPGPHVGRGPKGYERSSERIEEDVSERLTRHGRIDASNIEVSVEGDEVTLKGTVESRGEKRMAEDAAESVLGVRDVHNHLTVGEAS